MILNATVSLWLSYCVTLNNFVTISYFVIVSFSENVAHYKIVSCGLKASNNCCRCAIFLSCNFVKNSISLPIFLLQKVTFAVFHFAREGFCYYLNIFQIRPWNIWIGVLPEMPIPSYNKRGTFIKCIKCWFEIHTISPKHGIL